jgi:hypothetical protein
LRPNANSSAAGLWLFTGVLLVYVASANGYVDGQDGDLSYRVARSIIRSGSFEVSTATGEEVPSAAAAPKGRGGKSYAPFGLAAALEMVPSVWLGYALPVPLRLRDAASRAVASFTHAFVGAATVGGTYLVSLALGHSPLAALGAALSLALASPWWFYSNSTFTEVAQGGALFFALALLWAVPDAQPRLRRPLELGAAGLLAFLILLRLVNVVVVAAVTVVLVIAAMRASKPRDWLPAGFVTGALLTALGVAALYNHVRFGSMLETGYGAQATAFTVSAVPHNLVAYGVDPRRGMLVFAPLLVLGGFGYGTMRATLRLRHWRVLALTSGGALAVPYLLWPYGGNADFYGTRYLVPLYPLLTVGLAAFFDLLGRQAAGRLARWGVAALVAWSLAVAVPGVLINPWEFRQLAWEAARVREPPASFPSWQAAWSLVGSKLRGLPEVYLPEQFGLPPSPAVDLSTYEAFQGFDVWSAHASRQLHLPWMRYVSWVPAIMGLGLLILLVGSHWPARQATTVRRG